MNLKEYVNEKRVREYSDKYKECKNIEERIIYFDKLNEFLYESEKIYEISMKVAAEKHDSKIKKICEELKNDCMLINRNLSKKESDVIIIIFNIMNIFLDCISCIGILDKYADEEDED